MKKQILFCVCAALLGVGSLKAQSLNQRQSPEERTREALTKMAVLNLDSASKTKAGVIIGDFYKSQQKEMKTMRSNGPLNKEAIVAKRKQLTDERDNKLKEVLTADQLKKWQEEIEPSLRPLRAPVRRG